MVRKISIVFVTVLFVIGANGFGLFDFSTSSEEDNSYHPDDGEDDDDRSLMPFDGFRTLFDLSASADDAKWIEIDNLELIDYGEEVVEIEQLTQSSQVYGLMKYTLGKRIRGDAVVGFNAKNQTWPQYQDIKSNMTYPGNGVVGKNLSYIEVQVNQTSNLGQAYVVRGGVSKRFITIIVEAYRTIYFNFRTTFYGL